MDSGEHEDYCGSRTEKCEVCGEYIMLKNFDSHNKNDCKPKSKLKYQHLIHV